MKLDPKIGEKIFDLLKGPLGLTDDVRRFTLEWEVQNVPVLTVERVIKRCEDEATN